ncbi:hypothetical protein Poly30_40090 [Planctomycetes bacterium Poly30]|uniref:Uncharacterized protein n=1 Tax=Saltatorellus ferox TaxID=2528018 RepID=A0A518EWJ4_9BACT|nr:hypothetical protein Poly30_40090 [Planctomycetes bacterium Poly30]
MEEQEFPSRASEVVAVEASPRLRDVPRPARGFRSGPMAAVVATVAIVAATALPGPPRLTPAPVTPSPIVLSLAPEVMPDLETVGTLSLGGALTRFSLDTQGDGPVWAEREDGSAALSVRLVADEDPATYLEGILDFRHRSSAEALRGGSAELFSASVSDFPGFSPTLRVVGGEPYVDVYGSLAGLLVGGGALEGTSVEIRNVPGTLVRRGAWGSALKGRALNYGDTVFARVVWLREARGGSMAIDDAGEGSLGLSLVASHGASTR